MSLTEEAKNFESEKTRKVSRSLKFSARKGKGKRKAPTPARFMVPGSRFFSREVLKPQEEEEAL